MTKRKLSALFRSEVGLFVIYCLPGQLGFDLYFNDGMVGHYDAPGAAAAAVRNKTTGDSRWDAQVEHDGPESIEQWTGYYVGMEEPPPAAAGTGGNLKP